MAQKGTSRLGLDDHDLATLLQNLAKSARATTVSAEERVDEATDHLKGVGETVLEIVKSVDSIEELEQRIKMHGTEFGDAFRTFSQQIRDALAHIAESSSDQHAEQTHPVAEISVPEGDSSAHSESNRGEETL